MQDAEDLLWGKQQFDPILRQSAQHLRSKPSVARGGVDNAGDAVVPDDGSTTHGKGGNREPAISMARAHSCVAAEESSNRADDDDETDISAASAHDATADDGFYPHGHSFDAGGDVDSDEDVEDAAELGELAAPESEASSLFVLVPWQQRATFPMQAHT